MNLDLEQLRSAHPLRDSDFAAIRARVKAETAQHERPWLALLLRFAFAASLPMLFVPLVRERAPEVPVVVAKHGPPAAPAPAHPPAASPYRRARVRSSTTETAAVRTTPPAQRPAVSRIEIVTADPAIRIIWLTPKESS